MLLRVAIVQLGAGERVPQVVERSAPGTLDFKIVGRALAEQFITMTTPNFCIVTIHYVSNSCTPRLCLL